MKYLKKYETAIQNIKKKGGEKPAYSKDYAYSRYREILLGIAYNLIKIISFAIV